MTRDVIVSKDDGVLTRRTRKPARTVAARAVALLAAMLACVLAVGLAGPATATPRPAEPSTQLTWTQFKAEVAAHSIVIPAMRATGYGRMTITGLTRLSNGKYRAAWTLTNQDPRTPMSSANSVENAARSGFCWPWDTGIGSSCWNDPTSWNWTGIWNWAAPSPVSNTLTYDRQKACAAGSLKGTFGVAGKSALAAILGIKDQIAPNPIGLVLGYVVGCVMGIATS